MKMFSKRTMKRAALVLGACAVLALLIGGGFVAGLKTMRDEIRTANRDIGKIVAERGIDEARYIELGGLRQWITIRGQDHDKPVLLYLHGGPGSAMADYSHTIQRPWEDEFVVVQWDQRGTGRSAVDRDAARGTFTVNRFIDDTIQLLTYLNQRFGRKVVLVGQSWGTLLGTEVAKRRPDLLHAFVAIGQVVGWEENFAEGRRLLLERALQTGDKRLEAKMRALGPQPMARDDFAGERAWAAQSSQEVGDLGYSWHNSNGIWIRRFIAMGLMSPTMSDAELIATFRGRRAMTPEGFEQIIRDISGWRVAERVGTDYKVPFIMVMGRYDWQTPVTLARDYFKTICAPYKVWVEFPYAAHVVIAEEPGAFQRVLIEDVLPAVTGKVPEGAERCPKA